MGVVYSGRFNKFTGFVNKTDAAASAPKLMPAEIGWTGIPLQALSSSETLSGTAGDHFAIAVNNVTPSVFVYGLDNGSLPDRLIAEIPPAFGFTSGIAPRFVKMSPSGKYVAIRWAKSNNLSVLTDFQIEIFEIKADSVVKIPFAGASAVQFEWGEGDNYIYALWNAPVSGHTVEFGNPEKTGIRFPNGNYVDTNYPIRFLTSNHYIARTTRGTGLPKYRVYSVDKSTGISYVMDFPDELIDDVSGTFGVEYLPAPEGNGGDGYLVKYMTEYGSSPARVKLALYVFTGGAFSKLTTVADYQNSASGLNTIYSTGSAIILSSYASFSKARSVHVFSIDDGLKPVATNEQIPDYLDVVYNRIRDRALFIDHTTVAPYVLNSSGFKNKVAPAEPRFSFALTEKAEVTNALYPINPVFAEAATEMVDGAPGTRGTLSFNSYNYLDFMSVEGIVEFWAKPTGVNKNVFTFGNMSLKSMGTNNVLEFALTGDGYTNANNSPEWKKSLTFIPQTWHHYLVARNKEWVDLYVDGHLVWSLFTVATPPRQPPVGFFKNKEVKFDNAYFRDIRFTKGKASNLRKRFTSASTAIGFEPNDFRAITGKDWVAPAGGEITRL